MIGNLNIENSRYQVPMIYEICAEHCMDKLLIVVNINLILSTKLPTILKVSIVMDELLPISCMKIHTFFLCGYKKEYNIDLDITNTLWTQ